MVSNFIELYDKISSSNRIYGVSYFIFRHRKSFFIRGYSTHSEARLEVTPELYNSLKKLVKKSKISINDIFLSYTAKLRQLKFEKI